MLHERRDDLENRVPIFDVGRRLDAAGKLIDGEVVWIVTVARYCRDFK